MSWKDRVKTEILLDSPDGDSFSAFWVGNPRNFEKRLGFFDYPGVDGTRVQDQGSTAFSYPLTLYFEGENNDKEADRFVNACAQKGLWSIDHPIKGRLELQLVSIVENLAPVESGNVTVVETDWIKPPKDAGQKSAAQRKFEIQKGVGLLNITGSEQLQKLVTQVKSTEVFAFAVSVQKTVTTVTEKLKSLYTQSAEINAQISSVRRSITDTINQTVIDVAGLAGEIQHLVQLPTLVSTDISSRFSYYSDLADDLLTLSPDNTTTLDRNAIASQEAALVGTLGAIALITSTGTLETRQQAIDMTTSIEGIFNTVVNGLDSVQDSFSGEFVDLQYFSQSASYSDALSLISAALKHLLESAYDLAIEKRILLKKPRAPIEITITEYGSLGANDINFDLFIASNKLKGLDILLLPAGKEVVVYV